MAAGHKPASVNRETEKMNILTSLFRRAEKRRAYTDLMRLDDHLLRDIGLNRSDVHNMMAGTPTAHNKRLRTHE